MNLPASPYVSCIPRVPTAHTESTSPAATNEIPTGRRIELEKTKLFQSSTPTATKPMTAAIVRHHTNTYCQLPRPGGGQTRWPGATTVRTSEAPSKTSQSRVAENTNAANSQIPRPALNGRTSRSALRLHPPQTLQGLSIAFVLTGPLLKPLTGKDITFRAVLQSLIVHAALEDPAIR